MPSLPDVIQLSDPGVDQADAPAAPVASIPTTSRRKTQSGTEKRKRAGVMRFRITHTEHAEVEALAQAQGMEVGSYARQQALSEPVMRDGAPHDEKRPNWIPFRVSEAEREQIAALAARAGLTSGSYIRARSLNRTVTLTKRRASMEQAELVRLLGLLGNAASNLNQIARQLNSDGAVPLVEIDDTLATVRAAAQELLRSLGRSAS